MIQTINVIYYPLSFVAAWTCLFVYFSFTGREGEKGIYDNPSGRKKNPNQVMMNEL
jgi:hypothetical protein